MRIDFLLYYVATIVYAKCALHMHFSDDMVFSLTLVNFQFFF